MSTETTGAIAPEPYASTSASSERSGEAAVPASRGFSRGPVLVSVVIPVVQTDYRWLPDQLDRLLAQVDSPPFEVVVADNTGALKASHRGERVVRAVAGVGPAFARNAGACVAGGDVLLFCDADDLVDPDWVGAHTSALERSSLTVGAVLDLPPGDPRYGAALRGSFPTSGFSDRPYRHEGVAFATSANLGVRRDVFDRVGGFPVGYRRMQDVAMSLGLRATGVEPTFVPEARVLRVTRWTATELCRINWSSGRAMVRLRRDYGVGPRTGWIIARGAGRTSRSAARQLSRRSRAGERSPLLEMSRFAGSAFEAIAGATRPRREAATADGGR